MKLFKIEINKDELALLLQALEDGAYPEKVQEEVKLFFAEWNPSLFSTDTESAWAVFRGNMRALYRLVKTLMAVAEEITDSVGEHIGNKEKHEFVVAWLDDIVQLPFYLEPFDNLLFGMAVNFIYDGIFKK